MTNAFWQLGGWTMLHFLWAGAIVALAGGSLRLSCRRAAPAVRYAVSLTTLAALAALPIAIAAWLALDSPASVVFSLREKTPLAEREAYTRTPSQDGSAKYAPATPQVIDLATIPPPALNVPAKTSSQPLASASPDRRANPSPSPSLQGREMSAAALPSLNSVVPYLPYAWLLGAPLTFALLASGLVGSERLRRRSSLLTAGPTFDACERLRNAMRIARCVSVAACEGLAQPVLVGVVRPLILLPASALSGWTAEELEMVLVHELAHVRRWDNLVNLLQRIVESLSFFHPAVWLVSRQVRRDREECCDAVVVSRTAQPQRYAELLVSIAAKMQAPRAAFTMASAMADHPLAGRIRRILKLEDEPMWVSRRTLALTLLVPMLLAATLYAAAGDDENPPPSKGGARGGIESTSADPDNAEIDKRKPVDHLDPEVEIPRLQVAIKRLKSLIAREEKMLADLEIFKQLSPPRSTVAVLEKAIAERLEGDPTIAKYQEEILGLHEAIKELDKTSRNPSNPRRREIVSKLDEIYQALEKHRSAVDKAAREELKAEIPKEQLNPALEEYRKRRKAATDNLKKYKEELNEATSVLADLSQHATSQRSIASTEAAPQTQQEQLTALLTTLEKTREVIAAAEKELANLEEARQRVTSENKAEDLLDLLTARRIKRDTDYQSQLTLWRAIQSQLDRADVADNYDLLKRLRTLSEDTRAEAFARRNEIEEQVRKEIETPNEDELRAHVVQDLDKDAGMQRDRIKALNDQILNATRRLNELTRADRAETTATGSRARATTAADGTDRLQPGDEVTIEVVGAFPEAPINGPFVIEPQGTVALGATYGRVKIAGMSLLEAEKAVAEKLKEILTDVQVQVTLPPGRREREAAEDRPPSADVDVTVMQPPRFAAGKTTAYLRVNVTPPDGTALSPQEIERRVMMNQLDLVMSKEMMLAVSKLYRDSNQSEESGAKRRIEAHFPGDGEIMELTVRPGDAPSDDADPAKSRGVILVVPQDATSPEDDRALLQTVIDAYLAMDKRLGPRVFENPSPSPSLQGRGMHADDGGHTQYLYDGKTFEGWRSLWKSELNPERRSEAIAAFAAFARTEYGKEAAEAILDVAGQYDFSDVDQSPEGLLKQRIIEVLTGATSRVSETHWLPVLTEHLSADRQKWEQLAGVLLTQLRIMNAGGVKDPVAQKLLFELASDPEFESWHQALHLLLGGDSSVPLLPKTQRYVKEALTGEDRNRALHVLAMSEFRRLEELPEQVNLLFAADDFMRRAARGVLPNAGADARSELAEQLLAVLDDAERSSDHADAVRALGVLVKLDSQSPEELLKNWEGSKLYRQVIDRLSKLINEGPEELVPTALVAIGVDSGERVDGWLQGSTQPEDLQQRVRRARDKIDAEASRVMLKPEPAGGGGPAR
jgi:beta-lactamase regulating signal transducer with metallopeptidase domain